ncbi:MAG: cache domain-containing protein [Ignavibacteriales bacterium]|nr:cache domain-containing protein [Ignavibacteriales bacterium]
MKTIQSQLILAFSIAILVPALVTGYVGMRIITDQVITRAETKTISDLNSARELYRNKISEIHSITRLTALRKLVRAAVLNRDHAFLSKDFRSILEREKLDILSVTDARGTVIARGRNPALYGDIILEDRFIERVLRTRQPVSGTDLLTRDMLVKASPDLAANALMDIIPTPKAKERKDRQETSGMMLASAVPVFDDNDHFLGAIIGGVLLNRNFEIVDKIKEIVHEGQIYQGKEIGTATIFQGDLRISTNVRNADGSRALGTLVSSEVYDAVLREGKRWVGEAFVVNATYITAYEPIRDLMGNIIGMLYVGVLKQPFDDVLQRTLVTFLGIAFLGIILIVLASIFLARRISRPLRQLEEISKQIAEGDYKHDFTAKGPSEIEHLGRSLNVMSRQLETEKRELEEWGATLEKKVAERADEMKKINSQLFRSEKLASLGKLAAGVAHEINNPLTGILTNSSLLLEDLPADDPRREDVEVMVHETIRCREIVKRLLDFARQTKPQTRLASINTLIENIILLVRNQASFRNILIEKNLHGDMPDIHVDPDQIQQVFVNIILNAAEAMTKGGVLTISSTMSPQRDSLIVSIADTGPGISEEVRELIFDPFYTTKEHGTGLGLSISYGIVEQHGGTITVESTIGKGSVFVIQLPVQTSEGNGHTA